MQQTLIKWRLREVMARYNIKAVDLAKELGISSNSVSNLRKNNTMPRLDGGTLNNLCNALNKLAIDREEEITPSVLINYAIDSDDPHDKSNNTKEVAAQKAKLKTASTTTKNRIARQASDRTSSAVLKIAS